MSRSPDPPGVLYTVSPSALETFLDCERKHGLSRIANVPEKFKAGADLGGKVHKIIEARVKGEPPPGGFWIDPAAPLAGEIAASIMHHIPAVGAESEHEFWMPHPGLLEGAAWHGLIDVRVTSRQIPLVQDAKTTKDWKWIKTPSSLAVDVQANVYALDTMLATGAQEVDLEWLYSITSGGKRETRPQRTRLSLDDARRFVDALTPDANRLLANVKTSKTLAVIDRAAFAAQLPPSPDACQKYGGCSYYASPHCRMTASEAVLGFFSSTPTLPTNGSPMNTLQDQLRAQMNQAPAAPVTGPAPLASTGGGVPFGVPAATLPAPAASAVGGLGALLGNQPAPAPVAPVAPATPEPGTMAYAAIRAKAYPPIPAGACAPNGLPLPVTVTESGVIRVESGFAALAELAESNQASAVHYMNLAAEHYRTAQSKPVDVNPPEQERAISDDEQRAAILGEAQEKAAGKKGPGRPKKTQSVTNITNVSGTVAEDAGSIGGEPSAHDGVTLYIGCFPVGEPCASLEAVFAQAHADIAQANPGVLDFGQIQYEGSGRFRVYAEARFQQAVSNGARAFTIGDSTGREASIALASIRALCARVVQGSR